MGEWRGSELTCRWCVLAGMDLLGGSVADESTILAFRHLLEGKKLAEKILKVVNQCLAITAS